jgi:hypothetical protein
LVGEAPSETVFAQAGRIVSDHVWAFDDIHASAAYRKRICGTLAVLSLGESAAAAA